MPEIPDQLRAKIDENCFAWIRRVTGNPQATINMVAQERVYEIAGLAYRAGREDAAREEAPKIIDRARSLLAGFMGNDSGAELVVGLLSEAMWQAFGCTCRHRAELDGPVYVEDVTCPIHRWPADQTVKIAQGEDPDTPGGSDG